MLDWLQSFEGEDLVVIGTGIGGLVASIWMGVKGVTKDKPTSPAVAAAVESASCRAGDLLPLIRALTSEVEALNHSIARHDDRLERHDERIDNKVEPALRRIETEIAEIRSHVDRRR